MLSANLISEANSQEALLYEIIMKHSPNNNHKQLIEAIKIKGSLNKSFSIHGSKPQFFLHLALEQGRVNILEDLLIAGANTHLTDSEYCLPFQKAKGRHKTDIIKLLIEHFSTPNIQDINAHIDCFKNVSNEMNEPDQLVCINHLTSHMMGQDVSKLFKKQNKLQKEITEDENIHKFMGHLLRANGEIITSEEKIVAMEIWQQKDFLPFHIHNLFTLLCQLETNKESVENIQPPLSNLTKENLIKALKAELLSQISSLYMLHVLRILQQEQNKELNALFAESLSKKIKCLPLEKSDGPSSTKQLYIFPLSWTYQKPKLEDSSANRFSRFFHRVFQKNPKQELLKFAHAVYISFEKKQEVYEIIIDNLGEGLEYKHPEEGYNFHANNDGYIFPCVLHCKDELSLVTYLKWLIEISSSCFEDESSLLDIILPKVYGIGLLEHLTVGEYLSNSPFIFPRPKQKRNNCVVENHRPGMFRRLYKSLDLKDGDLFKKFQAWLYKKERMLIEDKSDFHLKTTNEIENSRDKICKQIQRHSQEKPSPSLVNSYRENLLSPSNTLNYASSSVIVKNLSLADERKGTTCSNQEEIKRQEVIKYAEINRNRFSSISFLEHLQQSAPVNYDKVNLASSNLSGADLSSISFVGAIFIRAEMYKVILKHTNLTEADITEAEGLSGIMLSEAIIENIIVGKNDNDNRRFLQDAKKIQQLEAEAKKKDEYIRVLNEKISQVAAHNEKLQFLSLGGI